MAVDSYSARARFVLQATGNNLNVWGQKLNASAIQLIEDATKGAVSITVSGPVTLTSALGATDQARMATLACTGTGGLLTAPGVQNQCVVDATGATGAVTIGTGAGTVATIPAGLRAAVVCPDGVNYYVVQDPSARDYTDRQVLKANSGNLPGSAANGTFLATDGGNADWRYIQPIDVQGLPATLAANAALAVAFAVAL